MRSRAKKNRADDASSESCDIEEPGCLVHLRNHRTAIERTRLATAATSSFICSELLTKRRPKEHARNKIEHCKRRAFLRNSPCARGQIRAKSDPCSAVDFFVGNGSRGFFCLARLQFFLVAFLCSQLQNCQVFF